MRPYGCRDHGNGSIEAAFRMCVACRELRCGGDLWRAPPSRAARTGSPCGLLQARWSRLVDAAEPPRQTSSDPRGAPTLGGQERAAIVLRRGSPSAKGTLSEHHRGHPRPTREHPSFRGSTSCAVVVVVAANRVPAAVRARASGPAVERCRAKLAVMSDGRAVRCVPPPRS